jgi:hypothetical protein
LSVELMRDDYEKQISELETSLETVMQGDNSSLEAVRADYEKQLCELREACDRLAGDRSTVEDWEQVHV